MFTNFTIFSELFSQFLLRLLGTLIARLYQMERKQLSRLKPEEVVLYFSGKGMAEMCTMTVTTVEPTLIH